MAEPTSNVNVLEVPVDIVTNPNSLPPAHCLAAPSRESRELVVWGFTALAQLSKDYTRFEGADTPPKYSVFHSASEPGIAVAEYALRLNRHLDVGDEAMLLILVLIGRYTSMTGLLPSAQSVHRLILAAARVVTKAVHDFSCSGATFAYVGGIAASELSRLERHLLDGVRYSVFFVQDDLRHLVAALRTSRRCRSHEDALQAAAHGLRLPLPSLNATGSPPCAPPSEADLDFTPAAKAQPMRHHPSVHTPCGSLTATL